MAPEPWRGMWPGDVTAVKRLADRLHPGYPEDIAVLAERLTLYPAGCHVAERDDGGIIGYALSHPWLLGAPPALNAMLGSIPTTPDTYYLHDIALAETSRGQGIAGPVVEALKAHARGRQFATMTLVAVGYSRPFWERRGFRQVEDPSLTAKLATYGTAAAYMRCDL